MIKDTFKPIPKYMLKLIKEADLKNHSTQDGHTRFYSYLTKFKKQLVRVTVAVRNYRKKWLCKQVALHGVHSSKCYVKDMVFYNVAGYKVGWYEQGIGHYRKWFEGDTWGWADDKYFNIHSPIINKEFVFTFPEYKYSAIELYDGNDILNYLRLYEKYPQVEYLTKAGLQSLSTSKMILNQCKKDKKFCKWIYKNKDKLNNNKYYISSIIRAYNQNIEIDDIYNYDRFNLEFSRESNFKSLKKMLRKDEKETFLKYIIKQKTHGYSYIDYLTACEYLGLDMNEEKNRYPHDFKKWHDIRIDQYRTKRAYEEEQAKKELYTQFSNIANKYLTLQRNLKDDFVVIIAKSPTDLIFEGERLNHCVGRMNYDKRFIREESLIFFIRDKNNVDTPFVTMEYSLKDKKILQCYGEHDSRPDEKVLDFAYKVWLPYANRKIKKIA